MKFLTSSVFIVLLLAGCSGPNKAFVASMDATEKAVAPEFTKYVEFLSKHVDAFTAYVDADIQLSTQEKEDRLLMLRGLRLSDQEKATRLRALRLWREAIDEAAK